VYNRWGGGYNTIVVKGGDGMKKFTTTTTATEEISEITCDKCGADITKNEHGYFDDFLKVDKTWGYHSAWDGETHTFDICQRCYREWMEAFTVKVL
jgi:hypothetical protein